MDGNDVMLWVCGISCKVEYVILMVAQGYTALMVAAEYQPTAVQALVDGKSDVNATKKYVSVWDVLFCLCVWVTES